MNILYVIIIANVATTILAWRKSSIYEELIFSPSRIYKTKSYATFITSAFIHADVLHLAFNMVTLYFFGNILIENINAYFSFLITQWIFLALYFLSLIFSILPTYFKRRSDESYRCLGASGAVSAVLLAGIALNPTIQVGIFLIPFYIPGYMFAPLFLLLTAYLSKNPSSGINHSAHLWGALFGFCFIAIVYYFALNINLFDFFGRLFSNLF
ncbi:MAG: rhomboid family intramembrane serine protease [Alphaproteobacteria bacterium]|nr:rhomboid family intramembrane serine protease [Alphaproteobacteria bacterium]